MPEKLEKSVNGVRTVTKKGPGPVAKANGVVVKKEVVSNGHKKELPGKSAANGVKTVVKKEVKREVGSASVQKKEASSSGVKAVVKKSSVTTTEVKKEEKKEKKVYSLPGQKHDVPEERDPLRLFYESLHEQRPDSEMAQFWMMEHGLLDATHARKVLERKQRRQQNGTPVKPISRDVNLPGTKKQHPVANGRASKTIEQKGKRKREYSSEDDEDFIAKPKAVKRKLKT